MKNKSRVTVKKEDDGQTWTVTCPAGSMSTRDPNVAWRRLHEWRKFERETEETNR